MTRRAYLQEDIRLIRKYFPGARSVALRTPFDLTIAPEDPWTVRIDDCGSPAEAGWRGGLLWNH